MRLKYMIGKGDEFIFSGSFDHAFSRSTNYRFSPDHDIDFSEQRARRILWIKEVVQCTKGTIGRYAQIKKDSRGRIVQRRVLVVFEENYVVVLEQMKRSQDLKFISAFPADQDYIEKIRRRGFLEKIECPSLNGD